MNITSGAGMNDDPKDTPRKQRTVMMTDSEWRDLKETSAAAGMRVSAFIVHRLASAHREPEPDAGVAASLARIEQSVRVLEEIERLRMSEDPETWERIRELVEARVAIDRRLD